jgi:esterase
MTSVPHDYTYLRVKSLARFFVCHTIFIEILKNTYQLIAYAVKTNDNILFTLYSNTMPTQLLNYVQQGSGPHIMLIHGLLGSLDNLNMVAKDLREHFTVTSVDVRNHGDSFHENSMSYDELAKDIINVMEHLSIDKTHLLGHSMGGKIAMKVALSYPEKVNNLVVADIAPVQYPPHHNHILEGLQSIKLSEIKSRKEADSQLSQYVDQAGVRQFLLRNLSTVDGKLHFKCNLAFIANCYKDIMVGIDTQQQFSGETLFIKGGNSDYIIADHRPKILQLFPHSKAKIIQGTGHWLHAEKTVVFNKIVEDFLL